MFCGHIGEDEMAAVSLSLTVRLALNWKVDIYFLLKTIFDSQNNKTFIKIMNVIAYSVIYGQLTACDTIFPQVFGGSNKKVMGVYVQKGFLP